MCSHGIGAGTRGLRAPPSPGRGARPSTWFPREHRDTGHKTSGRALRDLMEMGRQASSHEAWLSPSQVQGQDHRRGVPGLPQPLPGTPGHHLRQGRTAAAGSCWRALPLAREAADQGAGPARHSSHVLRGSLGGTAEAEWSRALRRCLGAFPLGHMSKSTCRMACLFKRPGATSSRGKLPPVIGARSHEPTRTGSGGQATLPAQGMEAGRAPQVLL